MNFATENFRCLICADPERVWEELTATGRPLEWLYGLVAESTWQSGAPVRIGVDQSWEVAMVGEVLSVDRHRRLSFTLGDTPTDPSVFVTWELAGNANTTIVCLTIDETEPHRDTTHEIELAWLPVIQRLTTLLDDQGMAANKETNDSAS
jgi:uncharacterized protein YndB with AHSA1/START domain